MKRVVFGILLGYECNNNCIFCYDGYFRNRIPPISTEEAKRLLQFGREQGANVAHILGGEPTIRRDIFELVKFAEDLGYDEIMMTTNGRMLSYPQFAEKIVDAGVNHIIFSIHGPKEIHDRMTRTPGAWEQAMRGLKNILKLRDEGREILVSNNTVITTINMQHLPWIVREFWPRRLNVLLFIYPHPEGNALKYYQKLAPPLDELRKHVLETIDTKEKLEKSIGNMGQRIGFRYVPLCLVWPRNLTYVDEYLEGQIIGSKEIHSGPDFMDLDVEEGRRQIGRTYTPKCRECKMKGICEGVWNYYTEVHGLRGIKPIKDA